MLIKKDDLEIPIFDTTQAHIDQVVEFILENFFGILKSELYYIKEKEYKNINELEKDIIEYIDYYNNKRIKCKLKGMSPVNYRTHYLNIA